MRERFSDLKAGIEKKILLSFNQDNAALDRILFYLDEEERIENSRDQVANVITENYFKGLLYFGSLWGLHHFIRLVNASQTEAIKAEKVAIESILLGFFLEVQYHFLAAQRDLFEIKLSRCKAEQNSMQKIESVTCEIRAIKNELTVLKKMMLKKWSYEDLLIKELSYAENAPNHITIYFYFLKKIKLMIDKIYRKPNDENETSWQNETNWQKAAFPEYQKQFLDSPTQTPTNFIEFLLRKSRTYVIDEPDYTEQMKLLLSDLMNHAENNPEFKSACEEINNLLSENTPTFEKVNSLEDTKLEQIYSVIKDMIHASQKTIYYYTKARLSTILPSLLKMIQEKQLLAANLSPLIPLHKSTGPFPIPSQPEKKQVSFFSEYSLRDAGSSASGNGVTLK